MTRRTRRVALAALGLVLALLAAVAVAQEEAAPADVAVTVTPTEATIGDALRATIRVSLPSDASLEPPTIGPSLGRFTVRAGAWSPPTADGDRTLWTWNGELSAFEIGNLEIPPVTLRIDRGGESYSASSVPVAVTIRSVLAEGEEQPGVAEPADIKPPASLEPDYGALRTALIILGVLLLVSLVLWWLHRRYASRLAAAPVPDDPFHRTPPHVWVYGELQRLLEQRLPEQGLVDSFYSELSRILKRYLSGRYRLELMERTTEEVPPSLKQAGAPETAILTCRTVLARSDRVKFAGEIPGPESWKAAIEDIYRIVDTTKPADARRRTAEGA